METVDSHIPDGNPPKRLIPHHYFNVRLDFVVPKDIKIIDNSRFEDVDIENLTFETKSICPKSKNCASPAAVPG
jgi:hypothetical protein